MVSQLIDTNERFVGILERLSAKAIDDYYNPYQMFEWPDELPEDMWWMSPELTTTHGTEIAERLTEQQLHTLSKYESVNFYSLNVHGIRELLIEVVKRIHTSGFRTPSEFFHHFVGEENEHMWFFAEFCNRYGKKIYKQMPGGAASLANSQAESLVVFLRILIFEELVDHFNSLMGADARLHETIRSINRIHHQDESRHIAFGRELVGVLYEDLKRTATPTELSDLDAYVRRYMTYSFETLYNPQVYRDAGIENPQRVRSELLAGAARADLEHQVFRKTRKFLEKSGIISQVEGAGR
ncbi:diiron oxygenase [Streptomyces sp. NPDC059477]|uniref:diiron oxygenase n=1 Tax=Streptomyces sp. NPDC059477 TaxID=3346847 RepID=UPI003681EA94